MRADVVVLGAGIVGISVAIHLQKRGRATVLVDRRGPGEATSFGNAGLIQREGVFPYGFPHDFGALLRYAFNRTIDAHYHPSALPRLVPFLWSYWRHSRPARHADIARLYSRLIERCVEEHDALAQEAGATDLIRRDGWIKLFRTPRERELRLAEAERWRRDFGVQFRALDARALHSVEPFLDPELAGGLHWTQPTSVRDPHALSLAYARLFERLGGRILTGDALTLDREPEGWRLATGAGSLTAREAVVALGPWAPELTRRFGFRIPFAVKRGYHMHYTPRDGARLTHPVLDAERGYLLVPMARGIRLTTGAEFARRDAPSTPVQLARAEPVARTLFPLGERLDAEPWLGARPCTPDMMPVIGPAPGRKGLWFAFGHAHHGLTLGPVTGRLLAEMMTGGTPFTDPAPFRADRF